MPPQTEAHASARFEALADRGPCDCRTRRTDAGRRPPSYMHMAGQEALRTAQSGQRLACAAPLDGDSELSARPSPASLAACRQGCRWEDQISKPVEQKLEAARSSSALFRSEESCRTC
eukprot:1619050-Pleurochrysis_carterae.AAC.2